MLAPSVIVGVLCCLAWVGALHHLVHLRRHSRLSPLAFRHRLLPLILALPLFLWLVPRLCSALWAPPVEAIILNGAPPIRIALKGQRPPPHAAYSRRRCVGNLEDVEETQGGGGGGPPTPVSPRPSTSPLSYAPIPATPTAHHCPIPPLPLHAHLLHPSPPNPPPPNPPPPKPPTS